MTQPHYHVAFEIARERSDQIMRHEWTAEHDDQHTRGEMALAAACYAWAAHGCTDYPLVVPPSQWPWADVWWSPHDRRTALVKAAALCVAEIERLDRLSGHAAGHQPQAVEPDICPCGETDAAGCAAWPDGECLAAIGHDEESIAAMTEYDGFEPDEHAIKVVDADDAYPSQALGWPDAAR